MNLHYHAVFLSHALGLSVGAANEHQDHGLTNSRAHSGDDSNDAQ